MSLPVTDSGEAFCVYANDVALGAGPSWSRYLAGGADLAQRLDARREKIAVAVDDSVEFAEEELNLLVGQL